MSKKKSLIVFAVCFLVLAGVFFVLPQEFYAKLGYVWEEFTLSVNYVFSRETFLNPFLAFTSPSFPIEETIFSEEIEPPPDLFAEEDSKDKTDEIITGTVEDMTGVGGPENTQEVLDDIAEKFDILKQQALELIEKYNSSNNNSEQNSENDETPDQPQDEQNTENENNDKQTQQQNNPSNPVYSKILISEVQVAGLAGQKEEFVELYNPNTAEIDLTGWYLQKKTKTGSNYSSFVPNTLFSGKKIGANDYFIIARENSSFVGLANIIADNSLAEDNSLILKNPNGERADKLGFGSAQEFETSSTQNPEKGQSIGRKWDTANNIEQDTDNNLIDFEAQTPTPKTKNITYVLPPVFSGGGGGGGPAPVVYPKILISEVQVAGLTEEKEEFVELYNPNNEELALTGWYLHRKTETGSGYSTFASNTLFSGKRIGAMGYFLIAREESSFASLADIITDNSLGNNGSSSALALKNPNGEISDKVGFGLAQDFESVSTISPEKGQSIGRKWDTINNIEQDTDNNSVDFEAQNPTPKAKNSAYVVPENPPLGPAPAEEDKTAPEVAFNLGALQTSLTFTINFEITDIIGTVTPSGIDSYIFQWQEEGGSWQEDALVQIDASPLAFSGTREFAEGQDEKTYYFQIKAKDTVGNESVWLPEIPATTQVMLPAIKPILINEIQIDGIVGVGGADDDWVELYNPNNVAVSLSGWSIQKHSQSDPCSTASSFKKVFFADNAVISAKGFFLIVSPKANDFLQNIVDAIMPSGWYLSDNNTVYLVRNQDKIENGDDTDIVDKVGFGLACFPKTSPALNPPETKSIERKELGLDTDDNSQDFIISETPTPGGN